MGLVMSWNGVSENKISIDMHKMDVRDFAVVKIRVIRVISVIMVIRLLRVLRVPGGSGLYFDQKHILKSGRWASPIRGLCPPAFLKT